METNGEPTVLTVTRHPVTWTIVRPDHTADHHTDLPNWLWSAAVLRTLGFHLGGTGSRPR